MSKVCDTLHQLCINSFNTRNFLKQQKAPLMNFFSDTKSFRFFCVTLLLWFTENFALDKWSMPELFIDKKFRTKIVIPAPPIYKVFRYQKLLETPKSSLTKFFGTVGQKIFEIFLSYTSLYGLLELSRPTDGQRRLRGLLCSNCAVDVKHRNIPSKKLSDLICGYHLPIQKSIAVILIR